MEKKPFHEKVAENLIEQLQKGTAPWQRPWQPGEPGAFLPINPTSGKRYKGINAIHLMSQDRDDQRWMTYKQAAALGAQVRKGEKGTQVQYWKFNEEQTVKDDTGRPVVDGKGNPVKAMVELDRPRVFFSMVFNAEQIDGLPPLVREKQEWNSIERAEKILSASGADIRHGGSDRAYYRTATDSIHLPDKGRFPDASNYYATALHELGHWTGHESRLARDLAHPFGSEGYAKEELRAEIASMMLGDDLGIGHDPGQHAAYVNSWIKALQDDPREIFRAAADAERIQNLVLSLEKEAAVEKSYVLTDDQFFVVRDDGQFGDFGSIDQAKKFTTPGEALKEALEFKKLHLTGLERSEIYVHKIESGDHIAEKSILQTGTPNAMKVLWKLNVREELPDFLRELHQKDVETPYQKELAHLLKLSTLTPGIYVPTEDMKNTNHAAVFVNDLPQILCGPAGDPESIAMAKALAKSSHVVDVFKDECLHGGIQTGVMVGRNIDWKEVESAIVAKKSGQVEVGEDSGPVVAIVLNDPAQALTTSLCVTTETARILDPDAPEFDGKLASLAKETSRPEKFFINVPYTEKDIALPLGAKWDKEAKSWYVPYDKDLTKFEAWLPNRNQAPAGLSPQEEFAQTLQKTGLILEGLPQMDGKIHRVQVEGGKAGSRDGAYCGYLDGRANGWAQNFRSGEKIKWVSTGHVLTEKNKEELQTEADARLKEMQAKAMKRAYARWMIATETNDHPYLSAKGVEKNGHGLKKDALGNLLIPGFDIETGWIRTLQRISPEGVKRFESGCPKKGALYLIEPEDKKDLTGEILIAEGYATGASLYQATGIPVAIAFDSDNLLDAAENIRKKYPHLEITICADNDHDNKTGVNVGVKKAKEAAFAVGGKVVVPSFTKEEKEKGCTDFNDLYVSRGKDAVKKQLSRSRSRSQSLGADR